MRDYVNELRDLAGSNDCHIAHEAADYIDALLARCEAVEARLAEAHDGCARRSRRDDPAADVPLSALWRTGAGK